MVDAEPPAAAATDATTPSEEQAQQQPAEEEALPKLTDREFKQFNRLAEHMDYFHDNFRNMWNTLYDACKNGKRPTNMTLRQFIGTGLQFCEYLEMHHGIEERHVFPMLARKMPSFRRDLELVGQHREIHKGLVQLQAYLEDCKCGEKELRLPELKTVMDTFGEVLWAHLDDEVRQLGAENMRKYWTLAEINRLHF